MPSPFSEDEANIVRAEARAGRKATDAAHALSVAGFFRSRSAVLGWAHRNGVTFGGGRQHHVRHKAPSPPRPERVRAPRAEVAKAPLPPPKMRSTPAKNAPPQPIRRNPVSAKDRIFAEPQSPAARRRAHLRPWPTSEEAQPITCNAIPFIGADGYPQIADGCSYSTGETKDGTFVWCNAPRWHGSNYCGYHYTRVYVRG